MFQPVNWSFVAQLLLTVFLCFNSCRTIRTMYFYTILKFPILRFERQVVIANIPIPTCVVNCSKPVAWYCYSFNEFFIPFLHCCIREIPEPLLLMFHSWLCWPSTAKLYDIIANTICVFQSFDRDPLYWLLLTPMHFPTILFENFNIRYCYPMIPLSPGMTKVLQTCHFWHIVVNLTLLY